MKMFFGFIQAFLLFRGVLSLPIEQSQQPQVLTDEQGYLTRVFQPLALVLQDPLNPQSYSALSFDSDRNHAQTLEKQNQIMKIGESLSHQITKTLLSPLTTINNHISSAVSQLPARLATSGEMLGSAIATPIQLGTQASNHIASGITGTLVSLPIAVGSGITAQMIGIMDSAQEVAANTSAEIQKYLKQYYGNIFPRPGGKSLTIPTTETPTLVGGKAQQSEFLDQNDDKKQMININVPPLAASGPRGH